MYAAEGMHPQTWGAQLKRRLGCASQLVVFGLILLLLYYSSYLFLRGPLPGAPQIIAHRGDSAHAPENTLAAFRSAVAKGVDWLEMDVQMTNDGALVVIHDATVDRTTNGAGRVSELTLAEIQALDAGNGEKVPAFEEVIEYAKSADVKILPEAKWPELYPDLERVMLEAIQEAEYTDRTVIQSFRAETLDRLAALDQEQALCALYGIGRFDWGGPQPGDARYVCPMAEMALLYPWMIRQAHREGRSVFVWFGALENPVTMRLLVEFGVDGLMVDDPDGLRQVIEAR